MINPIRGYMNWLHTRWPAGHVEKLPRANDDGSTNVAGLYIVGDLTGVPLLKFSSDTGARAVASITADSAFQKRQQQQDIYDLIIIGAGVSGMAAAIEARKAALSFAILEAAQPFSTVVNFPKAKPIYTYPTDMTPAGELQFSSRSDIKEGLVQELNEFAKRYDIEPRIAHVEQVTRRGGVLECAIGDGQVLRAHRVIVAIGRSGNFRELGVPGEQLDKVYNRLHDPQDFCEKKAVVVGGGDSALETAIALATCGSDVTMSYRKPEFSRPKPDNIDKLNSLIVDPEADVAVEEPSSERVTTAAGRFIGDGEHESGSIRAMMNSRVKLIDDDRVVITNDAGADETIDNDVVFSMIGREAPLDFFRKSGVHIHGEWRTRTWVGLIVMLLLCFWIYHWKSDYIIPFGLKDTFNRYVGLNPGDLWDWIAASSGDYFTREGAFGHTLKISASGRSFYYTLAYSLCVLILGVRRIVRRRTPYVTVQTTVLTVIQWLPLFILPELILPWMGHNGWFDGGIGGWFTSEFFPAVDHGHGREYWRAYGFIIAWPLFVSNFFTDQPLWGWLIVGSLQTFVVIPWLIYYFGKGAYCGWICPCGALAETMGDTQRQKMPHGPKWNRLNMIGQVFLALAVILMVLRIVAWARPGSAWGRTYDFLLSGLPLLNYRWMVDLLWAGILGVGLYFHFSGRVWCRFGCPLAALMHVYARFSLFRILADKKKCISCNVCTSVCHQGIDIMNFANKGLPMEDPQCVRCSVCVQSCPTGVLSFGQIDRTSGSVLSVDRLAASPVQMAELTVNSKAV